MSIPNRLLAASLILCSLIGALSVNIVLNTGQYITEEDGNGRLWCAFTDKRPISKCQWTLPDKRSCLVDLNSPSCTSDEDVSFVGNSFNCSIDIANVQNMHNGNWQCLITDEQQQSFSANPSLLVATQGTIEFQEYFSSLEVTAGEKQTYVCLVKNVRPKGTFKWWVQYSSGGAVSEQMLEVQQSEPPISRQLDNEVFSDQSSVDFVPLPEYNEGKLYCEYIQLDHNGKKLFAQKPTDIHLSLSVNYIKEPTEEKVLPSVQPSNDLEVTMEFEAHPKPNVVWVIDQPGKTIEVPAAAGSFSPEDNNRYHAIPIVALAENRYSATLHIKNVQKEDMSFGHYMRVQFDDYSLSKALKFQVKVADNLNDEEPDEVIEEQGGSSNTAMIVIIVLIILVVIALITAALVFYAKKKQIWCFASSGITTLPQPVEIELQSPLTAGGPDLPPIVKTRNSENWKRPQ